MSISAWQNAGHRWRLSTWDVGKPPKWERPLVTRTWYFPKISNSSGFFGTMVGYNHSSLIWWARGKKTTTTQQLAWRHQQSLYIPTTVDIWICGHPGSHWRYLRPVQCTSCRSTSIENGKFPSSRSTLGWDMGRKETMWRDGCGL